ncbi:DNA-processing protein DprA [Leuconostocaceae bacterium ESL0958]|nr:DNA-processing protein DprA [Leuconostocaceae bacterium ESL0958]
MDQRTFLLALHLTKGIGPARAAKVIAQMKAGLTPTDYPWSFATLVAILAESNRKGLLQLAVAYQNSLVGAATYVGHYVTYFDDCYPERLRQTYQAPLVLFYQGDLRALSLPALAIVGTRNPTPYGQAVIRALLPELIDAGLSIVSGLAKGIDIMAHQATFANRGVPIAVIGTGLDRVYPKQHHHLQRQVGEQGLLLSEYPWGTAPLKGHFPARNRLIAGLASATLVVEALGRSGSLITANWALQENRTVLTIPGSILAPTSAGPNDLIKAGAEPVTSGTDILRAVQLLP